MTELSPSCQTALSRSDIICLQECNLGGPPLRFTDTDRLAGLASTKEPIRNRALLTKDAGIIVRNERIEIIDSQLGPRWAYALLLLPPPANAPLPATPASHGSRLLSVFSIHRPFTGSAWGPIGAAVQRLYLDLSRACLIGADWNSVPDPILDSLNARPTRVLWSAPASAIAPLGLCDTFRLLRPVEPSSTYIRTDSEGTAPTLQCARRLDSIWCSSRLAPLLTDARTSHSSSDHRAVTINLGTAPEKLAPFGPRDDNPRWALHPALWLSPTFLAAVRHFA
ncbi:hypothetical protein V8E36_004445, partial [Tilletia maclaganii]